MGQKVNPDILQQKIQEVVTQEVAIALGCRIELSELDQLWILIDNYNGDILVKIVDLIKEILKEYQIIDNYLIVDINDKNIVYYSSVNQSSNREENEGDRQSILQEETVSYKSANFSVGFIVFILGILSLTVFGVSYYFTRPCVLGDNCTVITETETATNDLLNSFNKDNLTEEEIKDLIANLVTNIQTLEKIPSWAKNHQEAQDLITNYRTKISDLQLFLDGENVAENARNMSAKLPLSVEEWERVQTFWQDAIAPLQSVKNEEFKGFQQNRIESYQQQLSQVETQIAQEKLAINKLENAQKTIQEIKNQEANIKSLEQLKEVEQKWRGVILEIEQIPAQTKVYAEKEKFVNDYLQKISQIQQKINLEEKALNLKKNIEEKMKLAQESEKQNQWTKAVNFWKEAVILTNNISPESWLKEDIEKQKNLAEGKLEIAQEALKKALKKQEITAEVKQICEDSEKICTYKVGDRNIQIFLTPEYMNKIKSLSTMGNLTNNNQQEQQVINHINQVEKNYQYLSSKYKLPVEVYNPQQQLIMIYNSYI